MITTIIFDLDGLLVDTEIIAYKVYKELLSKYGHGFTIEEYTQNYSGKTEVANVTNLIETYHLPWTLETGLEQVLKVENRLLSEGVKLKRGARELLTFLRERHYNIAIASSSTEERALNILKQHNIANFFDAFVFAHEVEKGKPNPDIFLKACEKLRELPQNCLVLEDSEAGIQAAYSANIPVICIPDIKIPDKEFLDKATLVLDSLDKVIGYLSNAVKGK